MEIGEERRGKGSGGTEGGGEEHRWDGKSGGGNCVANGAGFANHRIP